MVAVSGACGKLVLGWTSDLWPRNRLLLSVSATVLLSYTLFFESSNLALDLFGAVSIGFFSSAIFPIMQALMADSCNMTQALTNIATRETGNNSQS